MKNKYYIDGNAELYGEKLINMKKNCYYLYRAFTNLYKSAKDNSPIGGPFRPALLTGELQREDRLTGFNTNRLGLKLKFLTVSLSDSANLKMFKNSLLYNTVLESMSCGTLVDIDEQWLNYRHTNNCEPALETKTSLDGALICQRDDLNAPLGLDFSKLIDLFVQTDGYGNYYPEDKYSFEEEELVVQAISAQLKTMKEHKRFQANYFNPLI